MNAVDDELGGALEEGLDAPPEEEGLIDGVAGVQDEPEEVEDLSYAAMFANVLGKGDGVFEGEDEDPLADFLAEQQHVGFGDSHHAPSPASSAFGTGSIALGGLLAASTPSEEAFSQHTGFNASRGVLDMPFPSPPPVPHHQHLSAGIMTMPSPMGAGSMEQHKTLTAQELEAQLRGQAGVSYQQGPPQFQTPAPPVIMQPPQMVSHAQRGVFTPEMIMQQQQQQQPVHMMPVPPPAQPAPPPPGPWQAQPPRPPMQSNNLAQRLKALNLADKTSPVKPAPPPRGRLSSKCMFKDEIESILFMQSKALHMAPPYLEDYYFQAFLDKYYEQINRDTFAPESVRELAPTEKVAAENVSFVKLEGLGRVAFSNIRRPRPLMDLSSETVADESNSESQIQQMKRLEQEPALAARIMIEDCMALILDVQDVDRIFIASGGRNIENEDALKQRRTLLMEGLASSLRLSEVPQGKASDSDGVFLRLLTRNKGKVLATRALKTIHPPEEMNLSSKKVAPNYRVLWALLRQLATVFKKDSFQSISSPLLKQEAVNSLAMLAKGLSDAIFKIKSPHALGDALVALTTGRLLDDDEGIDFFSPGECSADENRRPWMGDVIGALLSRGADLGLHETVTDGSHSNDWSKGIEHIFDILQKYLSSVEKKVKSCKDENARKIMKQGIPVPLIGQMVCPHLTERQKTTIQDMLLNLGV